VRAALAAGDHELDILPQAMRCEATARAGTPSRRHDDAVVVSVCLRQLADGTWDPGWASRAGSAAREFPDEGAWQADVGDRGGVGDELCRGALHGRFGGSDAWLKALPDYQLGLVKCVDTGQNAAVSYPHSADVG
jgi:hypothetical protein